MNLTPSQATLDAVRRLSDACPRSLAEAQALAHRWWPHADPNNLDTIVALWRDQRRPKAPEVTPVVIVSKIT